MALALILLLICAGTVAWIMTIRSSLLAEQLEAERARHEHLAELGLAAAGLAHETKNPLGIIMGLAHRVAGNEEVPPEAREMAEHIVDEVDRASARLGGFLTFARQREARQTAVDARAAVAKVVDVMLPDFDSAGVRLTAEVEPVRIRADEEVLAQMVVNLLLNSLHASSAGTTVRLRLTVRGRSAALSVEDEGTGVEPNLLPDVFKPYVSGRADQAVPAGRLAARGATAPRRERLS
jgi:two-component system sensor histidine kinase HydH